MIYFNIFEYNHFFSDFQLPFFSLSMLKLESVGKAKGIMKDQEERWARGLRVKHKMLNKYLSIIFVGEWEGVEFKS